VNPGSLTHCNGSAVVRSGNTSVVCGVRAEILKEEDIPGTAVYTAKTTDDETGNENMGGKEEQEEDDREEIETLRLLVPNLELSTGSTPQNLPGNAPSSVAQTLITRLHSLLLSTRLLRAADLRIAHTPSINPEDPDTPAEKVLKGYWMLYIDIFFISLDGNAFDAAWLAVVSALRNTRLPYAYFDEELEMILCDDNPSNARSLKLRGLPVPCTFAVFEGKKDEEDGKWEWVLSDPDAFEEALCRESVTVVVDQGKLRKIEKSGGGVVGREIIKELVDRSKGQWAVWEEALRKA
jgi:exosome complex component RRP43